MMIDYSYYIYLTLYSISTLYLLLPYYPTLPLWGTVPKSSKGRGMQASWRQCAWVAAWVYLQLWIEAVWRVAPAAAAVLVAAPAAVVAVGALRGDVEAEEGETGEGDHRAWL